MKIEHHLNHSVRSNEVAVNAEVKCKISGEPLYPVVDLGNFYISNFLNEVNPHAPKAPLTLALCEKSGFLQLMHTVDRNTLFRQYWYQSGTNATMPRQLRDIVETITRWAVLSDGDIVLDVGCNDGTLLSIYPDDVSLVKVGMDPAKNMEEKAKKVCDLHAVNYFGKDIFLQLTGGRKAKVVTSIAMFYSVCDPHQFVQDISEILRDDGIWVVQMSYTPLMIEQNAFDNICHEHIGYYTLNCFEYLVRQHGLRILDVELNEVNGGSFRLIISRDKRVGDSVPVFYRNLGRMHYESLLNYERTHGYDRPEVYLQFMRRIISLKEQTMYFLQSLKQQGLNICGYGASTKGNTLLQFYGIDKDVLSGIAERQPAKCGCFSVGSWIPIISEAEMRRIKPDYLFILPWHFIQEFMKREHDLRSKGSLFILPLPELLVL